MTPTRARRTTSDAPGTELFRCRGGHVPALQKVVEALTPEALTPEALNKPGTPYEKRWGFDLRSP